MNQLAMRTFTRVFDSAEMKLFTLASSEKVWKYPRHQVAQATEVTWMMQSWVGGGGGVAHTLFFFPERFFLF
jgi:hypothetical protein